MLFIEHMLLLHDSYVLAWRHSFSLPFQVCSLQTQVSGLSSEGKPGKM